MIKVVVADDEELVRYGLRAILEADPDITVVADACNGAEAVERVREHAPDVVLLDIRMPVMDGIAAMRELNRLPRPPRIIALTTFGFDDYVYSALRNGAAGFLLKDTPPAELIHAVQVVARGDAMLSPAVTAQLISAFRQRGGVGDAERSKLATLTGRERDVLGLIAIGLANADIAARLHMSEATVKAHVSQILAKLGATNRVQAAILARDAGLAADNAS